MSSPITSKNAAGTVVGFKSKQDANGEYICAGTGEATTYGGVKIYRNLDLEIVGQVVKASPGQLYGGYFFNNHATLIRYVHIYNKATTPVVVSGSPPTGDTPVMTIACPAQVNTPIPASIVGIEFLLGIGLRATSGFADTDVGAVDANELQANLLYF